MIKSLEMGISFNDNFALPGKAIALALVTLIALFSCNDKTEKKLDYASDLLTISPVTDGVYQHTSFLETETMGAVPCNGMIYRKDGEVIIFDTPVTDEAAAELIEWIGKERIKAVIATHFHVDCLGGLSAFHANNVRSYASFHTIELAKQNGVQILPQNGFSEDYIFNVGGDTVSALYFGAGHTQDNTVGYIPGQKTLFGGCLIKAAGASKGNLADADVSAWPVTVEKIKRDLAEVTHVIPGHGKSGGPELLDYTIRLFAEPYHAVDSINTLAKIDRKAITFNGRFLSGLSWRDKLGHNTLILSEKGSYDGGDGRKELFAYHYVKRDDTFELLWDLNDFVDGAGCDLNIELIQFFPFVSDVDSNGIAETAIFYSLDDRCDASPFPAKLIVHERNNKMAISGIRAQYLGPPEDVHNRYRAEANLPPEPYKTIDTISSSMDDAIIEFYARQWDDFILLENQSEGVSPDSLRTRI